MHLLELTQPNVVKHGEKNGGDDTERDCPKRPGLGRLRVADGQFPIASSTLRFTICEKQLHELHELKVQKVSEKGKK